ncbi:hypothetical protein JOM56_009681 [Amanita muscaria]
MGLHILVIRPQMDITRHHTLNHLQSLGIIRNVISDSQVQQISPAWTALLSYLGSVMQLATGIAQIHPIARLAVTAVAFAFEAAAQQCERAKRIDGLVEKMAAIYHLIIGAKPLESVEPFAKTLERLLKTTEDCALFVAEYCRNQTFVVNAAQGALSRVGRLIESYERAFADLRLEFISDAALHTTIQTIRILEEVQDIAENVHVINVAINLPLHGGGWDLLDRCLPGSQKSVLDDITHWTIFQDPVVPIYVLVGDAGCGKTCVAASIAATFRSSGTSGRLGASVFLDRENREHRDPTKIFPSIARELAAFDDKLKVRISRAISQQPDLVRSGPEQQLQKLIIEPLSNLTIIGPILIVIDGLDMQPDFAAVFAALQNARNVPRNLRILITARPGESVAANYRFRRMTVDEEELVNDVQNYTYQCLQVLQDIRPSIFADVSLQEVLADFETKSLGVFLWLAVAIRFLTIASDDTVRAFLAEIMAAKQPKNYSESTAALKHAIRSALMATSPIKLKSELSVGGAAALGVVGLKSDKTNQVVQKLRANRMLKCGDDTAGQYLSAIHHPGSRCAGKDADSHRCTHGDLQGTQHTSLCMAHVCIDFLSTRLASDVCTSTYHEHRDKEVVIDPSQVNKAPDHLRLYVDEAYRYAGDSWIAHSKDAQRGCAVRDKLLGFTKHFYHLFALDNDAKKMSNMLGRFKEILHDINPYAVDDCSSPIDRFREHLDRPDYEYRNHPEHWDLVMDLRHGELCCPCPLFRSWRISSRNVCSFSGDVEYGNVTSAEPICLMVTPPVMPLAAEGGQTYRTIKQVELIVDRKNYDDEQQPLESTTIHVGVVIARPHDDVLPEWAKSSNVQIRDGAADQMKRPWLSPRAGQTSSTVVRWQDEMLHYEANHQSRCPLRPGDRLVIAAQADGLKYSGVVQQFSVTLNLEYDTA